MLYPKTLTRGDGAKALSLGGWRDGPKTLTRGDGGMEISHGDGEAANIAKTYAYTYQMCPYFYILLIFMWFGALGV